ncbi:DUF1254 domain-containing protein [Carboxylicivirga sp. A043]|uniref:DUF1254 domain-containing protein n=1 Tax=Carboxylicivirga litoralis TaxID=2816963 RepID=UPI0021CB4FF2|nr:DUF1254 domain-containing protein [Carboxylicivirga sp. A043]MCU4156090.1 DUF1254 domain-containing protein [Carboxylicivirga sp. A043]
MYKKILAITLVGSIILWSCTEKQATQQDIPTYQQTTDIPEGITTPDHVSTSIGELKFLDGAPLPETAELVYDNLDRMRGVDVFLKGIPAASVHQLMVGPEALGVNAINKVIMTENLMDSKPLFLTANTSTLYVTPYLNLKETGPVVLEIPPGMLGAFNDAWFRYLCDIGPMGPDKGRGGQYLMVPPDYEGELPDDYFIVNSPSYRVWTFMRASIANGLDVAVKNIKDNMKVYPLSQKDNPPAMEFINGSGKTFNTIHDNDFNFYVHLNDVIQEEPLDLIDAETRGLLASIGIEKGKPFNPDERMKRILTDAVAIGNATARSIVWYPRTSGSVDNMSGIKVFPDSNSAWIMGFLDKNVFFNGKDGKTMNSDARVMFHYSYTAVTPAMAVTIPGVGSDYAIAYVDENKLPMDGSKTYKIHIPKNPPAKDFWALTIYDTQTRSMLQTDQVLPSVGSQDEGLLQNEDGSYDIFFGPKAPDGYDNNWLQTIPGKSWFVALRLYGPLKPWIEKTWRPSEILEVKE